MVNGLARFQLVHPPDHLGDRSEAQLGHVFAQFLGDVEHEVGHVFWLAHELGAQLWVLRGNAYRTGIQVTHPHHDATHTNQRRCRKAKLFRAQQRGHGHIAPSLELTIGLDGHSAAQVV